MTKSEAGDLEYFPILRMSGQAKNSWLTKRQVVLFLVAILLPCAGLVVLSLLIMSQQKELMEKRLAEEKRRTVDLVAHDLSVHLEKIKLQLMSAVSLQGNRRLPARFVDPAVVVAGWVDKDHLLLPWDVQPIVARSRKLLQEARFSEAIQKGERKELSAGQSTKAIGLYRAAMKEAHDPIQVAYARLLLARVMVKSGQEGEAVTHLRAIVALPPEVTDVQGIPLSLYAAQLMLKARVGQEGVLDRLKSEAISLSERPPAEAYMVRDLAAVVAESAELPGIRSEAIGLQQELASDIKRLEEELALQNDFSKLGLSEPRAAEAQNRDSVWVLYGKDPWLVNVATGPVELPPMAIAVRANDVFARLSIADLRSSGPTPRLQWRVWPGSAGETIGENFPGLKVQIFTNDTGALAQQGRLQRWFYLITLLLVLSATLFGADLLWRDVRREMHLAEMRSQFVSSVTHELKTPLTAIRMFAETLRLGRATSPRMQTEYLDTIVNESERLTRLLNNVLDFSRIEQGQRTYRLEPSSLADVVQAATKSLLYPFAEQGFQLRMDIDDGLPIVRLDPDAIQQAVLNLLTNAMKYSGESHEIHLRLLCQNRNAVIQVTDHGVGIPASEQSRIFEKFHRVPTPENRLIPGTGLGLTIVDHIVKAHGGRVEVQSAPGKGSVFSIYLPLGGQA